MTKKRKIKWTTTKIIAAGYFTVIALGTLLLMLPVSNRGGGLFYGCLVYGYVCYLCDGPGYS